MTVTEEASYDELRDPRLLLTYRDACKVANVSLRTLKEAKLSGDLAFVAIGVRGVRFTREDLDAWAERKRVPSRHEMPVRSLGRGSR